jgi:16S rRNA (guanine(966)-N(2))-methyltransferase RsmD
VLDLFAGSGALGFEALSRGAENVVFVEKAKTALTLIQKNSEALKVTERVKVLAGSVTTYVKELIELGPFQLVFVDPPYEDGWELRILNEMPWNLLLVDNGRLCLEWGTQKSQVDELPEEVNGLQKIREKKYGESVLTTYTKL